MIKNQQKKLRVRKKKETFNTLVSVLIFVITQLGFGQNLEAQKITFNVERWEKNQNTPHCEPFLSEKRFYKDSTLIYLIKFNFNNEKDSIVFDYNENNLLSKQIEYSIDYKNIVSNQYNSVEYLYNQNKELINVQSQLKSVQKYSPKYLNLKFENFLGLLDLEFSDIDLVISNAEDLPEKKELKSGNYKLSYTSGFRMRDVSRYGVPLNSVLKIMNLFVKNKQIIKDEFIFNDVKLTRIYKYKNDRIFQILINLKFEKKNIKSVVFFKYK